MNDHMVHIEANYIMYCHSIVSGFACFSAHRCSVASSYTSMFCCIAEEQKAQKTLINRLLLNQMHGGLSHVLAHLHSQLAGDAIDSFQACQAERIALSSDSKQAVKTSKAG